MDLQSIRLFIDVARLGSFAAAARRRDVDPSSVSRAMSVLEAELGFVLFHRTTRRLALTEAGARYHERIEGVVDQLLCAEEEARDVVSGPSGTLRVTACTSFGERVIAPLLPAFRRAYPELAVDLLLADHQVDLVAEQIDLAIRFGPRPRGDFAVARLMPRHFRVCASPSFLDAHGCPGTPGELRSAECMLFSTPGYRDVWRFRRGASEVVDVPVTGHLRVSHGVTMTRCVLAGLGIALLPDWLCDDEIARGDLVDLFPAHDCAANEFDTAAWMIYPNRHYRTLKVDTFVSHLRERFPADPRRNGSHR